MKRTEALMMRRRIETAVQSLPANDALSVVTLHPAWAVGIVLAVGMRVRYGGKLYEVLQAHTAQADWTPDAAVSLFTVVNEVHTGTESDPIPYEGNMALVNGLYYTQDGVVYKCTRDTVNPVYAALRDLVGLYVEQAS